MSKTPGMQVSIQKFNHRDHIVLTAVRWRKDYRPDTKKTTILTHIFA